MDKYDETAIKLCEDQDRAHHGGWTCSLCRHIAAALRESAAEAYADVANNGRSYKYCVDQVVALRAHEVKTGEKQI